MSISFEDLKFNDKTPVYNQIVQYIKSRILLGYFEDGEPLPSRRALAVKLSVNPNTIQKTYKQLEDEGIIVTPNNSKSIICANDRIMKKIHHDLVKGEAQEFLKFLKGLNLSFKDVMDLISELWDDV